MGILIFIIGIEKPVVREHLPNFIVLLNNPCNVFA